MSGHLPAVMVSSTFFDLRQIRADLAQFIEKEMGYRGLLSEFASFPIDPDADTVENCCRRVEQDADIMVLVIGGRYGFVDQASSKSVTNLEYLRARAKGIPIYAFVEKSVLTLLPVWERNPTVDLSHAVTDVRLFEFIRQVRSIDRVWTHEFEYAQEIVSTLRRQFAYLMREGLQNRMRFSNQPELRNLHGKSLRIALEKPEAWEYRLFAQALIDEMEAVADLRLEYKLGFAVGFGDQVGKEEAPNWVLARLKELEMSSHALSSLLNVTLQEALGPPGVPGNLEAIVFVARKIGAVYRHALEWSHRVRRANVHECFRSVARELSLFTDSLIQNIENFGPDLLRSLEEELLAGSDGTARVLEFTLKIDLSNLDQFEKALDQATKDCFGI